MNTHILIYATYDHICYNYTNMHVRPILMTEGMCSSNVYTFFRHVYDQV